MEVFDVTTVSWLVGRDAAVNWELVTTSTKHYCIILPNVLLWHRWDSGKLLRVLASMRQTKAHFVFERGKVIQAEFNNRDGLSYRFFSGCGAENRSKDRKYLGITVLTQISCSRFKQSKISMLISHIHVSGFFCKLFGDFWVHLRINSFSHRDKWNLWT